MSDSLEIWLRTVGGELHIDAFREQGFDSLWEVVEAELNDADLKDGLGLKQMRSRKAILKSLASLHLHPSARAAEATFMSENAGTPGATGAVAATTRATDALVMEIKVAAEPGIATTAQSTAQTDMEWRKFHPSPTSDQLDQKDHKFAGVIRENEPARVGLGWLHRDRDTESLTLSLSSPPAVPVPKNPVTTPSGDRHVALVREPLCCVPKLPSANSMSLCIPRRPTMTETRAIYRYKMGTSSLSLKNFSQMVGGKVRPLQRADCVALLRIGAQGTCSTAIQTSLG